MDFTELRIGTSLSMENVVLFPWGMWFYFHGVMWFYSHGERGSIPMGNVVLFPWRMWLYSQRKVISHGPYNVSHGESQLFPMGMPLPHEELNKQFDRALCLYTLIPFSRMVKRPLW